MPGKWWKTSNDRPLLEFTGHQPTLLYCSSHAFSLPAKCWCLKYWTPWQWLLLRVWQWEVTVFFWLSGCEWSFINEWIFEKVVELAATKCIFIQLQKMCFLYERIVISCSFIMIPLCVSLLGQRFFFPFQNSRLFIMCTFVLSSPCIYIHLRTCTHPLLPAFPIPLLTSPRSLSIHPVLPEATPLALA